MSKKPKLREKWFWNRDLSVAVITISSSMIVVAILLLFPIISIHALWLLPALLFSFLPGIIFGIVGKKIEDLKKKYDDEKGEMEESLMVIGNIHSPGIVILQEETIILVPLAGNLLILSLENISEIKEGKWLPGKYLFGKKVFTFNYPDTGRVAFAVAETTGSRWSEYLRNFKKNRD